MDTVASHYTTGDLLARIESAFESAGTTLSTATPEQMAAMDQFHIRGLEASKQLAALARFESVHHVLDVGCGVGGPARFLNSLVGCQVTGLDLTQEFVDAATAITEARGLSGRVRFVQGSALETPFEDATFDGAWMQHLNMNIQDKTALFREIARVLRPGATYALHEILADQADQPHFPVPWSATPEGSFLAPDQKVKAALEDSGFRIREWRDETAESLAWFQAAAAKVQAEGPPPISLATLLGPRFKEMAQNMVRSLAEGRIKVVMAVAERSATAARP